MRVGSLLLLLLAALACCAQTPSTADLPSPLDAPGARAEAVFLVQAEESLAAVEVAPSNGWVCLCLKRVVALAVECVYDEPAGRPGAGRACGYVYDSTTRLLRIDPSGAREDVLVVVRLERHSQQGPSWVYDVIEYHSGAYDVQYTRARHYDPSIGRFVQRDPEDASPGMSQYVYGLSSPTVYVDPSGMLPQVIADDTLGVFSSASGFKGLSGVAASTNTSFTSNRSVSKSQILDHLRWYGHDTAWVYHGHGVQDSAGRVVALTGYSKTTSFALTGAGGPVGYVGGELGAVSGVTGDNIFASEITGARSSKSPSGPAVIIISGCKGDWLLPAFQKGGARVVFYYQYTVQEVQAAHATNRLVEALLQGHTLANTLYGGRQKFLAEHGPLRASELAKPTAGYGAAGQMMDVWVSNPAYMNKTLLQILSLP